MKAGQLSLAAEWLLDNNYIAAQSLSQVQQDLPPAFERQLPRLDTGQLRVYELSSRIIRIEQALLDPGRVNSFVAADQEVLPLTMGVLWALPAMLRLGILECLVAATARITQLPLEGIEEAVAAAAPAGEIGDQFVVENSIRSLRALAVQDWMRFFESLSLVESHLRQDPARLYTGMDFETRDRYRKAVEEIAASGQGDEVVVAQIAVGLARARAGQFLQLSAPAPSGSALPDGGVDPVGPPPGWARP